MTKVRRLVATPELVPEGRALFVAPNGEGFRIWMLTPRVVTVADELLAALVRRDTRGLSAAFASAARARRSSCARPSANPGSPVARRDWSWRAAGFASYLSPRPNRTASWSSPSRTII